MTDWLDKYLQARVHFMTNFKRIDAKLQDGGGLVDPRLVGIRLFLLESVGMLLGMVDQQGRDEVIAPFVGQ